MRRPFPQILMDLLFPPRCPFCGRPQARDLRQPCPKCKTASFWTKDLEAIRPGAFFSFCVCPGWYEGALRTSVLQFKFANHPEYAQAYGPVLADCIRERLADRWDLLSWIPVSLETREKRGYDQARLLAEETAATLGCYALPLLEKTEETVPQSSLSDAKARRENVKGVYQAVNRERLAGARVLLMDDIITTGSTLNEGAGVLLRAGAKQVYGAALCRVRPPEER